MEEKRETKHFEAKGGSTATHRSSRPSNRASRRPSQLKIVKGLHIAEIGPGDYLTFGFALLAGAAQSYTAIPGLARVFDGLESRNTGLKETS